jgi:hypothetical protein
MVLNRLFRSPLHEQSDPAQRLRGAAELPANSAALAGLLADDAAPEVRAAAAMRCSNVAALASAWRTESDAVVRAALATALGTLLANTQDDETAKSFLYDHACTDAIRAEVARGTHDEDRRRVAIAALREEHSLVDLAIAAPRADTRIAAAERVQTLEGLRKLADAARDKDRGVARLARKRIDAIVGLASQAAEADAILEQLESLTTTPGPILTAVLALDRRWQALALGQDAARLARWSAAREALLARFDREREEQQAQVRYQRRLSALIANQEPPTTPETLASLRDELAALREAAEAHGDSSTPGKLEALERRMNAWTQELQVRADAEALVTEAEQLAAGTSIDDASLPERWAALDRAVRTPGLTRRFEAALLLVEQRRLAQVRAADQTASAARQEVHRLLHVAEQALAAGQVQGARAAADEIRNRKPDAGHLPKPTTQRLNRLQQQLADLERWESFGQQHARMGLCERAEALATRTLDAPQLAAEVRKLRAEWKALDQQHAGVPKAVWERFDRACEKAYAPAARHFAELTAQRRDARKGREAFIEAFGAHATTLLQEPRDWRAIEHWLRDADRTWRDGDLGSVEPKAWGALEARFRAATAPVRDALAAARAEAKAARKVLIDEAAALLGAAMERDAPSRVKALQARWQEQAKAFALAQRDERALWEQFRAACNAIFDARQAKRLQEDSARLEHQRAFEAICAQLEELARAADRDEGDVRRALRALDEQWRTRNAESPAPARALEDRFRAAKAAVDAALSALDRAREGAVWQTLAAKERLCEELDVIVRTSERPAGNGAAVAAPERWAALPLLPSTWEARMLARRDAALRALADSGAAAAYATRIDQGREPRAEILLELEIALGLASPAELQAQRLALQVKQLRQRFQSAASSGTDRDRLLAWCSEPGIADARDRSRCENVFAAIATRQATRPGRTG